MRNRLAGFWRGLSRRGKIALVSVAVLLVLVASAQGNGSGPTASSGPGLVASQVAAPAPSGVSQGTVTPSATTLQQPKAPEPTATAAPLLDFNPIKLTGRGTKI